MERGKYVSSPGIEAQLPCHLSCSLVTVLKASNQPNKQQAQGHIPGLSAVPASCDMETLQL